jgi:AcrR family transcriptional regulator
VSRRPLTPQQAEAQRRRLIEATFTVIAATGNASPAVHPILVEARLSRQSFYRFFASKDDLMEAVRVEGRRLLVDYLTARIARATTPEAKVRAWVAGIMRQAERPWAAERTRPFVTSLGAGDARDAAEIAESERELCALLADVLTEGAAADAWDTSDPATDALYIHDIVIGSLRRHLLSRRKPSPETTEAMGDFALRAIGASTARLSPWARLTR